MTSQVIAEAEEIGANLIITHHPVIFTPIKRVVSFDVQGNLVIKLIKSNINHIAAHTNLDRAEKGVDYALTKALKLNHDVVSDNGYVWGGHYVKPIQSNKFIDIIKNQLKLDPLVIVGDMPSEITKVAVCSGAGGGEIKVAYDMGYRVFITGELKHDLAIVANELGICVIVAGHYQTESIVLPILQDHLQNLHNSVQCTVEIKVSEKESSPRRYL